MITKLRIQNSEFRINRGFTLIELLVVISIIGILAALLTSSYSQAQKQGRDAKRRGDLKAIQNAFEQYKVTVGNYPKIEDQAKPYFQDQLVPCDPRGGRDSDGACITTGAYKYNYVYDDTDGKSYCVCALLEVTPNKGNATNNTCSFGVGDYVCVQQLQ